MGARLTFAIKDDRKGLKVRPGMATRLILAIKDDRKSQALEKCGQGRPPV
jgi:hypothetical protein